MKAEGITFKEFIKCSYSPATSIFLTFYQLSRLYKCCFKLSLIRLILCFRNPPNQGAKNYRRPRRKFRRELQCRTEIGNFAILCGIFKFANSRFCFRVFNSSCKPLLHFFIGGPFNADISVIRGTV